MAEGSRWQFWIDRGGTFTDCLGRGPRNGAVRVAKVLSSDRAPLEGIREILGLAPDAPIPPCDIRMGTTIATNALLERRGVPSGLAITRGFADLLEIGTQARPEIFALQIRKPETLYARVLEVDARVDASGAVLQTPDWDSLRVELTKLRGAGLRSLAIVILHAYRAPQLERDIGRVAREVGFEHVALSHDVAAEIGVLGRGDTCCVDAYLTPLIRDYVRTLLDELEGSSLRLMQSGGGLTDARRFRGPHAILSGPAGGVVAYAAIARDAGFPEAIGFDMGGTSTDVSRYGGDFERTYESETGGVRIRAPMMAIHTVAAGGGSLCRFDGYRLRVGPESAGAVPGPLCYGRSDARELTLTDVNLALGRVQADRFPFPLDRTRVDEALEQLRARLSAAGFDRTPTEIAAGFVEIANANMAEAIRRVSVARGYDVRDHALVVFGGAGGQHACALARRLSIRNVVFHPHAGVLSAYGMGIADVTWHGERDLAARALGAALDQRLAEIYAALEAEARDALVGEGFRAETIELIRRVDLRYRGTETALSIELSRSGPPRELFEQLHRQQFGYIRPDAVVEAVVARLEAVGRTEPPIEPELEEAGSLPEPIRRAPVVIDGRVNERTPVYGREQLGPGHRIAGPVLVLENTGTIVVDAGFELHVDRKNRIRLVDRAGAPAQQSAGSERDPVQLEIFNNLFRSIAEQMGVVLRRTAFSTNIRERLDFSCAVFERDGSLVANAPHIPVHLGAMGESVRAVLRAHDVIEPGDAFVTNDPAAGGSHLPDVTVVTPVHDERGELRFFVASRGHHADIGGRTPGSMPPFSSSLDEEGVVLRGIRVVRGGYFDEHKLRGVLNSSRYPARDPVQNLADLEAQLAANRTGERLLLEMVERYGLDTVNAYMRYAQDNAAAKVEGEIAKLADGEHDFEDRLDDGTPIRVRVKIAGSRMRVDFSGTGAQVEGNLNAPRAVTLAAVIYVLRALVGEDIPLNSGCLRPVEVVIPDGSLLSPLPDAAVCGGNVETSQRIVDVLLAALGKLAASQGTMNNLTFGNDAFAYYETIGGGAGAGEGFDGKSGVHTHMTNTRITDPEVLEARFPVRLRRFALRPGSGGRGRWRGGDGLVREIEFLQPMRVALLSQRRERPAFGLRGGQPGAVGQNSIDGRLLAGSFSLDVEAGACLRVETPGGGGYGDSDTSA